MLKRDGGATPEPRQRVRARVKPSVLRRFRWPLTALLCSVLAVGLYSQLMSERRSGIEAVEADSAPLERTAELKPLSLPEDEGPHVSATEWWYYSGELEATDGQTYFLHVAVFLRDGMVRHTVFHGSLVNHDSNKRYARQLRTAGIPSSITDGGFDFRYQGWRVSGQAGEHVVSIEDAEFSLSLSLSDPDPVMLHRAAGSKTPGLLDFGEAGISYYYSRPRMRAVGSVSEAGRPPVQVKGEIWFDHQWGDFEGSRLAWNWFALQLNDGSDLMIYQLYDTAGSPVMTAGSWLRDGIVTTLGEHELSLQSRGVWQSPVSSVRYPAAWVIALPQGEVLVEPVHADSEFNALETTFKHYWEGPVRVSGALGGRGFLEMSGYDHIEAVQPPPD